MLMLLKQIQRAADPKTLVLLLIVVEAEATTAVLIESMMLLWSQKQRSFKQYSALLLCASLLINLRGATAS